jgi:hypothetical protein
MNYEERIINKILNTIKDNQTYLTKKENLPQLAKLGYMYNTLWYAGRIASYNGIISQESYKEEGETYYYPQCDENPKYKIEMCKPESEKIENYIYDAWGMHVQESYNYGTSSQEFLQIINNGKELSDIEIKLLKPNKTFDEWVEIKTNKDYRYHSIYPNRRAVANHLLCTIGNGYDFKKGFIIETASGEDQDRTDYGDWENAKFCNDIQVIVDMIIKDKEVELILKYIDELKEKKIQDELKKEKEKEDEEREMYGITLKELKESKEFKESIEKMFEKSEENFNYYPISNYSIITKINKNSDPSYIKAGIEICEYILANPPKYGKDYNKFQKDQCDYQTKFAENFIKKFK